MYWAHGVRAVRAESIEPGRAAHVAAPRDELGVPKALEGRLLKHPSAHQRWTGCAKDWRVVYHEVHDDKFAAYRRELEVKR